MLEKNNSLPKSFPVFPSDLAEHLSTSLFFLPSHSLLFLVCSFVPKHQAALLLLLPPHLHTHTFSAQPPLAPIASAPLPHFLLFLLIPSFSSSQTDFLPQIHIYFQGHIPEFFIFPPTLPLPACFCYILYKKAFFNPCKPLLCPNHFYTPGPPPHLPGFPRLTFTGLPHFLLVPLSVLLRTVTWLNP